MKKPRKKRTTIKKYGLYADHTDLKGVTETRQISTIETREGIEEANRTGRDLSKMLGMKFLHARELIKQ
jgi:hypothetical protein